MVAFPPARWGSGTAPAASDSVVFQEARWQRWYESSRLSRCGDMNVHCREKETSEQTGGERGGGVALDLR